MSPPPDGGRWIRDRARARFLSKGRRAPYLVRMIEPNPIRSHDWHVQPNCQRSFESFRLSGPFGSRPGLLRQGVLELVALVVFAIPRTIQPFWREPSNLIGLPPWCQLPVFRFSPRPPGLVAGGCSSRQRSASGGQEDSRPDTSRCAKISNNDQHLPEPLRLAGARSRVLQWGCSLRDSLQGPRDCFDLTRPYEPASLFPRGAGHTATGRLHCSFRSCLE